MCEIVGYIGQKNTTNPSKLNELGWKHKVELEDGIKTMYEWYLNNKENKYV